VYDGDWRVPADLPRVNEHKRQTLFSWVNEKLPDAPGVRMVIEDEGRAPNYDPRSGAMACDLLAAILDRVYGFTKDYQDTWLTELALQMHDSWTTGRCPQGRTTRLYQLWLSLPLQA
jgi:hypothetical protein